MSQLKALIFLLREVVVSAQADPSCAANPGCAGRGLLHGNCCPNDINVMLGCCNEEPPAPAPPPFVPPPGFPAKPSNPKQHNGVRLPALHFNTSSGHFMGIGDWGGDLVGKTWESPGKLDRRGRGPRDIDQYAQRYVARQMKFRAQRDAVDFVLNAGDNFYPGGITDNCGPRHVDVPDPTGQIKDHLNLYAGPGLKGAPWINCLGNHDYGGMSFGKGWDAQIFETWNWNDWIMPGQFYTIPIQYADFTVDIFVLDTNFMNALPNGLDHFHNICQLQDTPPQCWDMTLENCVHIMQDVWRGGVQMLEKELKASKAHWKIVLTHFPGPGVATQPDIKRLHSQYGIDLMFTGHTHYQFDGDTEGLRWIVSGGGGGVTSDVRPLEHGRDPSYGYVDFHITKNTLSYDMHAWGGFEAGKEAILSSKQIVKGSAEVVV